MIKFFNRSKSAHRAHRDEQFNITIESSGNGGLFAWDHLNRERMFFATTDELFDWIRGHFQSPEHSD